MTLTKNKMVREIGRRTRLKNREVQVMLEALVEVWAEELVSGGRIELENFLVLESRTVKGGKRFGKEIKKFRRVTLRISKSLKRKAALEE